MKAQSFFGGTKPNATGVRTRQVGTSSASGTPNGVINTRGRADTSTHANLSTSKAGRPNLPGKVDNRNIVGGKK